VNNDFKSFEKKYNTYLCLLNSLSLGILFTEINLVSQHNPNSESTWVGLESWIALSTDGEIFDIDIRLASNNTVFSQNLYDFGWNQDILLEDKKYTDRHKIIIYMCDFLDFTQLPQVHSVDKVFLISNYWQSIKHIYLPKNYIPLVGLFELTPIDDICDNKISQDNSLISVITVVFNGEDRLEQTIQSVINQTCKYFEYIIIDGGSKDGTVDIIKKYNQNIAHWTSEKDFGIYDAMNKGIKAAKGSWLIFMNCGDLFVSNECLQKVPLDQQIDFYYSDTILFNDKLVKFRQCSHEKKMVIHQSIIYQKKLHDSYSYLVHKGLTISDYLFFRANDNKRWQKLSYPISLYNTFGVSTTGSTHSMQKAFVDFLQGDLTYSGVLFRILQILVKLNLRKIIAVLKISYLR
jgi:Glycosyl transferase family 2